MILLVQDGPEDASSTSSQASLVTLGARCGHFEGALGPLSAYGVEFGLLWNHFGCMKVTFESLWPMFKKHLFFLRILMILNNSGITLGSFWGHFGPSRCKRGVHMKIIISPLYCRET